MDESAYELVVRLLRRQYRWGREEAQDIPHRFQHQRRVPEHERMGNPLEIVRPLGQFQFVFIDMSIRSGQRLEENSDGSPGVKIIIEYGEEPLAVVIVGRFLETRHTRRPT